MPALRFWAYVVALISLATLLAGGLPAASAAGKRVTHHSRHREASPHRPVVRIGTAYRAEWRRPSAPVVSPTARPVIRIGPAYRAERRH